MFGIVPKPLWQRHIAPDDQNRIPLQMRCLLLEGHGRLVLVDCGLGDKVDDKFRKIYAVDPDAPTLARSLDRAGFGMDDVTDLVLTHLHFDHCGGATVRDGDRLRVAFPNAEIHVQEEHWEWAKVSPREGASFLAENLEPLEASGQLRLIGPHAFGGAGQHGDPQLFPNVETVVVNGHTHGQQLLKIADDDQALLFAADLLPTTAHVPLLWNMGYDIEPLKTVAEKEALLPQAADEGWLVLFEHDTETAVARIERTARGFAAVDRAPTLS
jgi:glyoxylase-like metal-dependent hydrolase (beta-lactamase superfamily II)